MNNKFFLRVLWLLIPLLTLFNLSAWGAETTFTVNVETGSTSMSKDDISVSTTSGTFSRTDNYRVYANNSMTISSSSGNITKVVFTVSQNTFTADVGTWTDGTKTWTGDASSITFSASGGQVRFTTFTVTYSATSPTLTVSGGATSLAMGDAKVNGSGVTNSTLTFSGANLTANATLSISGTDRTMFSVSPTNVNKGSGTITNQSFTVTYTPTAAGNHTATLTIASSGATSKTIALTGTGKYEVIWQNNGEDYTTTLVASGQKPTFPAVNPTSCDVGEGASTAFYGWAANGSTWSGKINSLAGKTIYTSEASLPTVSANGTTYHAVFCKGGSGSVTISQSDFTGSSLSASYSTQTVTAGDYDFEINACIQSSMCQMRDNATLSYIAIPTLPGPITGLSTTVCANGSGSSYSGTLHFKHTKTRGNDDTNDIGKTTLASVTSFDWDLSANTTYTSGYLLTSAGLRLKDLTITYGTAGTNYMTNCCTALGQINGSFNLTPLNPHKTFCISTI